MSVLIRGMKMPSDCAVCRFSIDGFCYASGTVNIGSVEERQVSKWCPLVPVQTGRWERPNGRPRSYMYKCSECREISFYLKHEDCKYRFCPWCGAKMEVTDGMSVLIKGIEMPKSCYECPIECEGDVCGITQGGCTWDERPPHCPIVPIPPHGRLIDADALMARCKDEKGIYKSYETAVIGESVELFPTIIEACEEGKS